MSEDIQPAAKPPDQLPTGKPLRVTMRDIRAAGMCASGARSWFARYGLDWCDFVKCGLPDRAILNTGDALGEVVVEKARQRASLGISQLPSLPTPEQLPSDAS